MVLASSLLVVILNACSPEDQEIPQTGQDPTPITEQGLDIAIDQARAELSEYLEVPAEQIDVESVIEETWPTDCMALPAWEEICAEVPTQGWIVMLRVNTSEGVQDYQFHTNHLGTDIRWLEALQEDLP